MAMLAHLVEQEVHITGVRFSSFTYAVTLIKIHSKKWRGVERLTHPTCKFDARQQLVAAIV